jgi:adenosylcobyric acid synthase
VNEVIREVLSGPKQDSIHAYTSAPGDLEVRDTLAQSLNRRFNAGCHANDLFLTTGAAPALCSCLKGLCCYGDQFIVIAPYFTEYRVFIEGAGGEVVEVNAQAGTFLLDIPAIEKVINPRVKGVIINKFRGDERILTPGLRQLEDLIHIPVVGVVPYVKLDIDDEDSLSERLTARQRGAAVDVAVVRLPKISNFTDFIALEAAEGIGLRYVSRPAELGNPDLIILPGTKSTMDDLRWLRTTGLEAAILRASDRGCSVLGICGGYQMLGELISDPEGMEAAGEMAGMGLLPVQTVFGREKRTVQSEGTFGEVGGVLSALSGQPVLGYEIHMGRTERRGGQPLVALGRGGTDHVEDGCQCGNVYGCYLHGLFDRPEVTQALVGALLARKGLDVASVRAVDMAAYRQRQYDVLADGIRTHTDMRLVHRIIEEGL